MRVLIYLQYPNVGEYPKPDTKGYTDAYKAAIAEYAARLEEAIDAQYQVFLSVYGAHLTIEHRKRCFVVAKMSEAFFGQMKKDAVSFIEHLYPIVDTPTTFTWTPPPPVVYYELDYQEYQLMAMQFMSIDPSRYDYNVVTDMEWNNDEEHAYDVDAAVDVTTIEELEEWVLPEITDKEQAEMKQYAWQRKDVSLPSPGEMLNLMAAHGVIPAGKYVISVSW
jgi:hypothetical protein